MRLRLFDDAAHRGKGLEQSTLFMSAQTGKRPQPYQWEQRHYAGQLHLDINLDLDIITFLKDTAKAT